MDRIRIAARAWRVRAARRRAARRGRRRSIVNDLVALVLVTLIPLLVLGGYLAYRNVRSEQATIYAAALGHARSTAGRADEVVAETQALLTGLALTPTLRGGDPAAVRALLRETKTRYPYFDDLLAVDASGAVYAAASSHASPGADGEWAAVRVAPGDESVIVGEVQPSPLSGRPVLLVGIPVREANGANRPIGAVVAALDLSLLQLWLDDRTLPPDTTITVVDNRSRRVLARTDEPERWIGRTLPDTPTVRTALAEPEGIIDEMALDGFTPLNGFATAKQVPWTVLVGIPESIVEGPIAREGRLILLRFALAALVAVALAAVAALWIVRPLRELTAGANIIAAGDLHRRIAVRRRDEVGQVALATNHMADQLVGSLAAVRDEQERLQRAVGEVGRALTSAADPETLLTPLIEAAAALTRADAGILSLRDDVPPVTTGVGAEMTPALIATLRALAEEGAPGVPTEVPVAGELASALGLRRCLAAPATIGGETLGTLIVLRRHAAPFGAAEASLLRTFADQVAVALEQARLRQEVARAAALRELHRLQSDFLVTASHELRAPIAGVKGYAEMLLRPDLDLDEATRRDCLAGIARYADRLNAQVRAFFDAMRAGAGQLALGRAPLDLAALAASVVHGFAHRSALHTISLDAAPDLPPALADRERVEDVLTNLLDNALKYSPEGGPIAVTIAPDSAAAPTALRVAVRDAGLGIAPDEHERIFERFYRHDRLMARGAGGAGLGLFLCRSYVEAMGGAIAVESAPGAGSTFRFTLPVATGAPAIGQQREVLAP